MKYLFYLKILFLQFILSTFIKNLNNGGCGIFVSLFMKHYGNKNNCESVAYEEDCDESVELNQQNKTSCTHHFIKSKWYLFDGENFINPYIEYFNYDKEILDEIIKNQHNWNNEFNRNQIFKLEKIIKILL